MKLIKIAIENILTKYTFKNRKRLTGNSFFREFLHFVEIFLLTL